MAYLSVVFIKMKQAHKVMEYDFAGACILAGNYGVVVKTCYLF